MKLHQRRAERDKDGAENQRAQNAVKQNAVFVFGGNAEIAEDEDENKNVINRKRVFENVAGQKFERVFLSDFRTEFGGRILIKNEVKDERENNPDNAPDGRFLKRNGVRFAIENAQIEREHRKNKNQKQAVKPPVFGKREQRH